MSSINITAAGHVFEITIPDVLDKESWNVVRSEGIGGDKSDFILENLEKSFPKIVFRGNNTIEKLDFANKVGSRSAIVRETIINLNSKYATSANMPSWLKEIVPVSEMASAEKVLSKINALSTERVKKETNALEVYKKSKEAIEKDFKQKLGVLASNNIVKILALSSEQAPVSVACAIEAYSPAIADASSPSKRLYARELLTAWKISLLEYMRDNPDADLDGIISAMQKE